MTKERKGFHPHKTILFLPMVLSTMFLMMKSDIKKSGDGQGMTQKK